MAFETFDLGKVLQTAEAIKGMKRQETTDRLRDQYLQGSIAGQQQGQQLAASQESRAQTAFDAEQQIANTKILNVAAGEVAANPASAARWAPILQRLGMLDPKFDWKSQPPEKVQAFMQEVHEATSAALVDPTQRAQQGFAREMDQTNFEQQKQLAGMQFGQQKQLAGIQQAQQEKMAGVQHQYRLDEIEQQGANALMVAAQKANKNTAVDAAGVQKTWATYQQAKAGLLKGLEGADQTLTGTGAIAGRLPAVSAAQQTAEGSVAAMAPVLKQIFRIAGEGTFTDKDQELLLNMVPTRKDEPEARQAKLENIDNIIRAKLGITSDAPQGAQGKVVDFSALPP